MAFVDNQLTPEILQRLRKGAAMLTSVFLQVWTRLNRRRQRPWMMGNRLLMLELLAAIVVFAVAIFVFERPRRPDISFDDALWLAWVTLTTVGYGDYFAVTWAGRIYTALFMMFALTRFSQWIATISSDALIEKERIMAGKGSVAERVDKHLIIIDPTGNIDRLTQMIGNMRNLREWRERPVVVVCDDRVREFPEALRELEDVHFVAGPLDAEETFVRAGAIEALRAIVLTDVANPHADQMTASICYHLDHLGHGMTIAAQMVRESNRLYLERNGAGVVIPSSRLDALLSSSLSLQSALLEVVLDLFDLEQGMNLGTLHLPSLDGVRWRDLVTASTRMPEGFSALGLRRGSEILLAPSGDEVLEELDDLIVITSTAILRADPETVTDQLRQVLLPSSSDSLPNGPSHGGGFFQFLRQLFSFATP